MTDQNNDIFSVNLPLLPRYAAKGKTAPWGGYPTLDLRPPEKFFEQKINRTRKSDMIDFLSGHNRSFTTCQPFETATSYANSLHTHNIIRSLQGLSQAQLDLAHRVMTGEMLCPDWDSLVIKLAAAFRDATGYHLGFNGSDCEVVVLYATELTEDGHRAVLPYKGIDENEDYSTWSMTRLRGRTSLISEFDRACDILRAGLIRVVTAYIPGTLRLSPRKSRPILDRPAEPAAC